MSQPMTKRGTLGIWMLTALVAGNVIGSGIFMLPAALAEFGSISILAWLFTSCGAILLSLVFADLSQLVPKVGGPYAYCRAAFGDFVGFQIAYNYWIALWIGNSAIVVGFVAYLSFFWPALNTHPLLAFVTKLATLWLLTIINIYGVRSAGIVQLVTMLLKILPLAIIIIFGFFFFDASYLSTFNLTHQSSISALGGAATLTMWSFIGLESATVPAADADSPATIARATIIGTVFAAIIYILSTIVIMGMIPAHELMNTTAPYAAAANIIFSHLAQHFHTQPLIQHTLGILAGSLVAFGATISCFGALNGWTLLQGQIPYAAAQDKLFPVVFTKLSRFGTPIVGLVVSSILISGLLLLTINATLIKQFTLIILLATLASVIPYFFTCYAELTLLLQRRQQFSRKRLIKSALIAIFASGYAFFAIMGAGQEIIFYGTLLFLSSLPMYLWLQWSHSTRESS